jgi:hypothetical protein
MAVQHRRYRLTEGSLDTFVEVWAQQVVPLRRRFGFDVVGAWASRDPDLFVWLVAHDGDFAEAEQAYYTSPDRAGIDPDPASFIEDAEVTMVEAVSVP